MRKEIKAGDTLVSFDKADLRLKLSRPLNKKMYIELLTPEQVNKKETEARSNCQNKAIHMVGNDLFKNTGEMSAQDFYFDFKRNYLAFMIKADDAEYSDMITRFEALELVMGATEWRKLANKIYTHKDATVKQFHNAFDDFCLVHSSRGNQFRHPDDYKLMLQDEYYKELIK